MQFSSDLTWPLGQGMPRGCPLTPWVLNIALPTPSSPRSSKPMTANKDLSPFPVYRFYGLRNPYWPGGVASISLESCLLCSLFFKWGYWSQENWRHLPKTAWLVQKLSLLTLRLTGFLQTGGVRLRLPLKQVDMGIHSNVMSDCDKGGSGEGETQSSRCPLNIKAPQGIIRHLSSCCLIVPKCRAEDVYALCFSKAGPFPKQFSVMTTQVHFNVFANEFPWYWKIISFFFCNVSSPFPQRNSHSFFFFFQVTEKSILMRQ